MQEEMTASIRLTDERVKQAIDEKIKALEAVEKVYEERILEMEKVWKQRVKTAEERGQSQIKAVCAPLELKLKSLAMEIESIEEEELERSRYLINYCHIYPKENGINGIRSLGYAHNAFAKKLRNILEQLRH